MIIEFLALALAQPSVASTPDGAQLEPQLQVDGTEGLPAPGATEQADPAPTSGTAPAATPEAADPSQPATPDLTDPMGPDIVVTASERVPGDPIAAINVETFAVTQAVDGAVIAPIARTYEHNVPLPLRQGLHNVLNNLDEPIVFANFMLQLKPVSAVRTVGRFAINTVLGVGGLVDVAKRKPFSLPRRSNGLADTLGYYGVGPGPYLYLPIIGSTTVRDLAARPFDLFILPAIAPAPFKNPTVALAKGSLNALDERVNFDEDLRHLREESDAPYAAVRDYYLARRQAEIDYLRGRGPAVDDPDFEWKVKPARKTAPQTEQMSYQQK